jgi:NAD(P)-dependent dehydrogenase (short-subunit alcohol dehydrogenase family)
MDAPTGSPRRALSTHDVTGQVAIVTGAGRGLGSLIAQTLARAGAHVVAVSRTETDLEALVAEVRDNGGSALPVVADVTKSDDVARMVQAAQAQLGGIDILVNNAGTAIRKLPEELTEADWDLQMDVNVKSAFLCSQAAGQLMREQRSGCIINMASVLGMVGLPRFLGYCTAKGALIQFTRALAVAWAPYNIRVNAIAPGFMDTPQMQYRKADPVLSEEVLQNVPMHAWGDPSGVAAAALYLASPAATFMTGHVLTLDGGYTAV